MLRVIRPALPAMGAGASIICLSSIMGVSYGWDQHVHYSSQRPAWLALVRGLAVELASRNIRVNGVAPGYIRTAQLLNPRHSLSPGRGATRLALHSDGASGRTRRIAAVIKFLASAERLLPDRAGGDGRWRLTPNRC